MSEKWAHIAVEFWFEASHQLWRPDWTPQDNERVFGPCTRLHGHSYHLIIHLHAPVSLETGMVMNFRDLKRIVRSEVVDCLDHRHLNEILSDLPTSENILHWIAGQLIRVLNPEAIERIELRETRTASAYLTHDDLKKAFRPDPS